MSDGSPLRNRAFLRLWSGGLINDLGDWTLLLALPIFVFQLTGSALVTSTVFVVELIPGLIAGQLGGVLVDRWDRKRILVVGGVVQALFLLPLLLVSGVDQLWIVYLVAAVESCPRASSSRRTRQSPLPTTWPGSSVRRSAGSPSRCSDWASWPSTP